MKLGNNDADRGGSEKGSCSPFCPRRVGGGGGWGRKSPDLFHKILSPINFTLTQIRIHKVNAESNLKV